MSELLPCPFCGGEAELTGFDAPEFWVWCPNCKASADAHTSKGGAIEAWNTRADDYRQAAEYWQRMYEEAFVERTCKSVNVNGYAFRFECSLCGYVAIVHNCEIRLDELPNYCPNCGAKVVDE